MEKQFDAMKAFIEKNGTDEIVGHKTISTGEINPETGFPALRHEPLTRAEADEIWKRADAAKAKRAADMPTEDDAVRALWSAYQRLCELGWRPARYCGHDGKDHRVVEAGSAGIHVGHRMEGGPDCWWIADAGDLWPSHPILAKPIEPSAAKRTASDKP